MMLKKSNMFHALDAHILTFNQKFLPISLICKYNVETDLKAFFNHKVRRFPGLRSCNLVIAPLQPKLAETQNFGGVKLSRCQPS